MKIEQIVCHKMSSRMKHENCKYSRRHHRPFINILTLSIMWTMWFTEVLARPNLEALLLSDKPTARLVKGQQQQDAFLNSLMAPTLNENLFSKLQKCLHNKPHSLKKWSGLQNLVLALDYDESNSLEETNEYLKSLIFGHLRQLVPTKPNNYNDDMAPEKRLAKSSKSSNQLIFKESNIKKNLQYMSPCHFKICNMGRKRYARDIQHY